MSSRLSCSLNVLKLHIHRRGTCPASRRPCRRRRLLLLHLLRPLRRRGKRLSSGARSIRRRLPTLLRYRQPNLAGLLLHRIVLPRWLLLLLLLLRGGRRLWPLPRLDLEVLAQQAVRHCRQADVKRDL